MQEFYCGSGGNNLNSGHTKSPTPSLSTPFNGGWDNATNTYLAVDNFTPGQVSVGDYASVYASGASVPALLGRVTNVYTNSLEISSTVRVGSLADGLNMYACRVGGCWAGPSATNTTFPFNLVTAALTDAGNRVRVNLRNDQVYTWRAGTSIPTELLAEGFSDEPGDDGVADIQTTAGASFTAFTVGTRATLSNVVITDNHVSGSSITVSVQTSAVVRRVGAVNARATAFQLGLNGATAIECFAAAFNRFSSGTGFIVGNNGAAAVRCLAVSSAGTGFLASSYGVLVCCVAVAPTGFSCTHSNGATLYRCVARKCATGLQTSNTNIPFLLGCVFSRNTSNAVNVSPSTSLPVLKHCVFHSNTNNFGGSFDPDTLVSPHYLSAEPFEDADAGDYSPTPALLEVCRSPGHPGPPVTPAPAWGGAVLLRGGGA